MFRKLRLKIALVLTAIIALLVAGLDVGVLVSMKTRNNARIEAELRMLVERLDRYGDAGEEFVPFSGDRFETWAIVDGQFVQITARPEYARGLIVVWYPALDTAYIESGAYTQAFAEELARGVIASGKSTYGNFRCVVIRTATAYKVAAVDESIEREMFFNTALVALSVSALGILLIFAVVWRLSAWMIRPVKESVEKQKAFVADASHELKTPLTVIDANAEALKQEIDANRWLDNIGAQTARMNGLVQEMLRLACLEENGDRVKEAPTQFDASRAALTAALAFEEVAFEAGKSLECEIEPGAVIKGAEKDFVEIVTVLTDNAVKYARAATAIRVTMERRGSRWTLAVQNEGCAFSDADREHLFERFYRADASRDRSTGGSGLGLAIAARAAERNRWKLDVDSREGEFVRFTLTMRDFHADFV